MLLARAFTGRSNRRYIDSFWRRGKNGLLIPCLLPSFPVILLSQNFWPNLGGSIIPYRPFMVSMWLFGSNESGTIAISEILTMALPEKTWNPAETYKKRTIKFKLPCFYETFCNRILALHYIPAPFAAGQTSSDCGAKHSVSRMTEISDVFSYPVVTVNKLCVLCPTWMATVD